MNDYQIHCVHENPKHRKSFADVPKKIYVNDLHYTKEDPDKILAEIDRFKPEDCLPLIVVRNNSAVARLCAIIPDAPLKGYEKENIG